MTPVLAIPFLAGDLRPCLESIDIPVRLIVIDNSPDGETWDVVPDDAHVIDMPGNIGYPMSVNLVIWSLPDEPFWLFANHDTVFAPGDLHRLVGATQSGEWGWVGIRDWRVFGITAETVERVGWFDPWFYPCYCEDADYERRCTLAGVRWGFIEGETSHVGSAIIRESREYARANQRSYPRNVEHYCEKWDVSSVRAPGGAQSPRHPEDTLPPLSRLRAQAWRPDGSPGT